MQVERINPYKDISDKSEQVERMFDSIARRYDKMNTVMSLGQHRRWRDKALKQAISQLIKGEKINVLDIATGTGDVAFRLHELLPQALITGIDLSEGMLDIARKKLDAMPYSEQKLITFGKGDSLSMPFHQSEFDLITVAYGVRNFSNIRRGIEEMRRVLSPGGVLCIIELSCPKSFILRKIYDFYTRSIIPGIGKKVTGDAQAYRYLPESISACPQREAMATLLYSAGFSRVEWKSLSLGALTYYIAK